MNDSLLLKLGIMGSLLGILALYFILVITGNTQILLVNAKVGDSVSLSGTISGLSLRENYGKIQLSDQNVTIILFPDKNLDFSIGEHITVRGRMEENNELLAYQIRK